MTSATIAEHPRSLQPVDESLVFLVESPCDCQLPERILCSLRLERELDAQFRLARAVESVDADVLFHDLRSAGQAIDRLLRLARTEEWR